MASWNCLDHRHNSPSSVATACDTGCVPPSMCPSTQQRYRCVVSVDNGPWTAKNPASPRPVPGQYPQMVSFCPQRHTKVHAAPHMDHPDIAYCPAASRFPTSSPTSADMSLCRTPATSEQPCYHPGTSSLPPLLEHITYCTVRELYRL